MTNRKLDEILQESRPCHHRIFTLHDIRNVKHTGADMWIAIVMRSKGPCFLSTISTMYVLSYHCHLHHLFTAHLHPYSFMTRSQTRIGFATAPCWDLP